MTPDSTTPAPGIGPGTVLITGGTGSLGNEAAKAITDAGPELTVVITGRGAHAVERAAAELEVVSGRPCTAWLWTWARSTTCADSSRS